MGTSRRVRWGIGLAAAAVALAPSVALADGPAGGAPADWWTRWSLSPLQLVPVVVGALLYAHRARRLGPRLPAWRAWCFYGGIAVLVLALVSPVDPVGEDGLFWVHMLQHVLLGDLAPLLVVLGVTGPVLRPALALRWVQRLRVLAHPAVALPLWTASLVAWHVPALYDAALRNDVVHALEHVSFFTFGALMWAPVLETLPAPAWFGTGAKIGYVAAVRAVGAILANVFWWSGSVLYPPYAASAPRYGMSGLEDQALAGTVMMAENGTVTLIVLTLFFFRMAREGELRQDLIERGYDADAVRRAVRYGRGEALARRFERS